MTSPGPIGFPRVYAVLKWTTIVLLTILAILAAAFWTLILGDFAGSGFHAPAKTGQADQEVVITPDCAWPYGIDDHEAKSVCRMFYNLDPKQREEVLKARRGLPRGG